MLLNEIILKSYKYDHFQLVRYSLPSGPSVAALFAESIQGVGGTVQFPRFAFID